MNQLQIWIGRTRLTTFSKSLVRYSAQEATQRHRLARNSRPEYRLHLRLLENVGLLLLKAINVDGLPEHEKTGED